MVTEEGSQDLSHALEGSFLFHGCIVIERSFYCQEENKQVEKGDRKRQNEKAMGLLLKEQENATMPLKATGKLLPETKHPAFLINIHPFK
jgi:hypothetical protein